jgi:hypothetical protein
MSRDRVFRRSTRSRHHSRAANSVIRSSRRSRRACKRVVWDQRLAHAAEFQSATIVGIGSQPSLWSAWRTRPSGSGAVRGDFRSHWVIEGRGQWRTLDLARCKLIPRSRLYVVTAPSAHAHRKHVTAAGAQQQMRPGRAAEGSWPGLADVIASHGGDDSWLQRALQYHGNGIVFY